MKSFFIIIFLIYSSSVFGKGTVYYCSETKKIGFDQSKNNKFTNFDIDRYKVLIDFEKRYIESKNLLFTNFVNSKCYLNKNVITNSPSLSCFNQWGVSFTIDQNTLNFKVSFTPSNKTDGMGISYGQCEKF